MSKIRLLCVYQEQGLFRLITAVLEDFEVVGADSAAAARRLVAEGEFDFYLLETLLGDESGLELCRFIKERVEEETPILFITGADPVTIGEMKKAGAQGHIAKGVSFVTELEKRIAQQFGK